MEVKGTLNYRPLTYVSSDDVEEPLTPFHLIYGRGILSLPEVTPGEEASLSQAASCRDGPRRRKYLPFLLDHFWKRWSKEYVAISQNLHRERRIPEGSISLSIGDVVNLFKDKLPRSQWRFGRVEQLIPGTEDNVRAAVVKVIAKRGRAMTVKRPVQRLFPLEVQKAMTNDEQPSEEQGTERRQTDETRGSFQR